MGIDTHALNLLRYAANRQPLGSVATLGRQSLLFDPGKFCEELLARELGATLVHSYDLSDFEGATHIADLNLPLNPERQYDTVFDGGTIEHVFNIPQALRNMWALCALGGQIIHVSPANNFCGHGFWQLSPELFFSLYRDAEVFLANTRITRYWFKVIRPNNGCRAEILSEDRAYVMCRATKHQDQFPASIQQSDYVATWNGAPKRSALKERFKHNEFIVDLYRRLFRGLNSRNPHLVKLSAASMLSRERTSSHPLESELRAAR